MLHGHDGPAWLNYGPGVRGTGSNFQIFLRIQDIAQPRGGANGPQSGKQDRIATPINKMII
jgi:hypothetical protein